MRSDPRVAQLNALLPENEPKCPFFACHRGPDALLYRALVVGPDGQQRAVVACVDHLWITVGKAVSQIRLEPFE